MVAMVQKLDPYMRPMMAPLGIFFPFPFNCRYLDTYMKSAADISEALKTSGGQRSECMPSIGKPHTHVPILYHLSIKATLFQLFQPP